MASYMGKFRSIAEAEFVFGEIRKNIGKDGNVVWEGFLWIARIALNDKFPACKKFVEMGVVDLLQFGMGAVDLLRDRMDARVVECIQLNGCYAYAMLAKYGDDEIRTALARVPEVYPVVNAMRQYKENIDIQLNGCCALRHFMRTEATIPNLREVNGIEEVLKAAMERYSHRLFYDENTECFTFGDIIPIMLQKLSSGITVIPSASTPSPPPRRPSVIQEAIVEVNRQLKVAQEEVARLERAKTSLMELE